MEALEVPVIPTLARLIRQARREYGVVTAHIYGGMGHGKTSYALWTAFYVVGSWDRVLNYLFFSPRDALRAMEKAIKARRRLPIIIMDDAATWLDKHTWWERDKVAFMQFFNLIRSIAASVVFTSPASDLPKGVESKMFYRVEVRRVKPREALEVLRSVLGWKRAELLVNAVAAEAKRFGLDPAELALVKGYRLRTLPSYTERVYTDFYDLVPLHYPVFREYDRIRARAVAHAFNKLKRTMSEKRASYKCLAAKLLENGVPRNEVAQTLMQLGVSRSTAYYWIKEILEGKGNIKC